MESFRAPGLNFRSLKQLATWGTSVPHPFASEAACELWGMDLCMTKCSVFSPARHVHYCLQHISRTVPSPALLRVCTMHPCVLRAPFHEAALNRSHTKRTGGNPVHLPPEAGAHDWSCLGHKCGKESRYWAFPVVGYRKRSDSSLDVSRQILLRMPNTTNLIKKTSVTLIRSFHWPRPSGWFLKELQCWRIELPRFKAHSFSLGIQLWFHIMSN